MGDIDIMIQRYKEIIPSCDQWDYIHKTLQDVAKSVNVSPPYGNWGLLEKSLRPAFPNIPCIAGNGTGNGEGNGLSKDKGSDWGTMLLVLGAAAVAIYLLGGKK